MKISHFKSPKALTLTELLVAMVLIGIVMVSVVSFTFTMRQIQGTTNKQAMLELWTNGAMAHITKAASQASGHQTDPGIILDPLGDWISFRIDFSNPPTPETYANDKWQIYIHDDINNTLQTCRNENVEGSDPAVGNCSIQANRQTLLSNLQDAQFTFAHDSTLASLSFYVEITLTTRNIPDDAVDPLDNPEYSLTTRVSPLSHSW